MVFKHKNYRELLEGMIKSQSRRGLKSQLARAAGCQLSYLSQVLKGSVHLTEDQAFGIANFLQFSESETDFFILLLRQEKAGSKNLRSHLGRKIKEVQIEQQKLSKKLEKPQLSFSSQEKYYSNWAHSAVHIALSIPGLQNRETIKKCLFLQDRELDEILQLLTSMGLVVPTQRFYEAANFDLHVSSDSPLLISYNLGWRAIHNQRLQSQDPTRDLYYTAVHSLSESDCEKIREMLADFITQSRKIVEDSPEEGLVSLALDFTRLY